MSLALPVGAVSWYVRALFLRVRAVDSNCAPPRVGLYSNTAIVYVLPQVTSDATLPISDRRTA